MSSRATIENGVIRRHTSVNPSVGNASRNFLRDMGAASSRKIRNNPMQEMFAWTHEEERLLRRTNPELFEGDARTRGKALRAFAQTSAGRAFICK